MQHCWVQHVTRIWPPCCDVLRHVGCCWLKFENGQIFHTTFVNLARCCSRLARFVQQCCVRACLLARQHIPTRRNRVVKRSCLCCVEMLRSFAWGLQMLGQRFCDMLSLNVRIVWPGLNTLHIARKTEDISP